MSTKLSDQAKTAQENARHQDGRFGEQARVDQGDVLVQLLSPSAMQAKSDRAARIAAKYPYLANPFVIAPEDSKVILPPKINDNSGYMGGSRFVGGKATTRDYVSQAKLVREDIKQAIKLGELPADLSYQVRSDWSLGVRIVVGKKLGGKASVMPKEFYQRDPDIDRWSDPTTRDAAAISNMERRGEGPERNQVETDQARQLITYLSALGSQWQRSDTNPMVDYFNFSGGCRVEFKHEWN